MRPLPRPALPSLFALTLLACGGGGGGDDGAQGESGSEATSGDGETETGTETGTETETETGDGDGDGEREALIAELEGWGPHEVGYESLEHSYTPPGASEPRTVGVELWYPAAPGSGAPPASYRLANFVNLPTGVGLAAPPVSEAGAFPVAIYSHGSGGDGILAYPYAERFASHGFIVLSPHHTGNTASDAFAGKSGPFRVSAYHRPLDITAILDGLEAGFGDAALAAATDSSRTFLFGHSFGGYTSLAVGGATLDHAALLAGCDPASCAVLDQPEVAAQFAAGFRDERVLAISPQAPGLIPELGPEQLAGLELPTMLQTGRLDINTTHAAQAQPAWDGLDHPDDLWVDLVYGAHYSFFTMCDDLDAELLALFEPNNVNDGCGPDFTPASETVPALGTYLLAFARLHVLGEAQWSVVLDGEALHPEFELSTHPG